MNCNAIDMHTYESVDNYRAKALNMHTNKINENNPPATSADFEEHDYSTLENPLEFPEMTTVDEELNSFKDDTPDYAAPQDSIP